MTVIADNKKRVTLPTQPGERFDIQIHGADKFVLTRLAPVKSRPNKMTIVKRAGFSVGKINAKINAEALAQALAEFP
jgi:hypothetical protein